MTISILLLNGPNLNLLGTREPGIYGSDTLKDVEANAAKTAKAKGAKIECFQSNHEGALIDKIHDARGKHQAIIINPGAFTHTSIAIRDALSGVAIPVYEIHISNVHAREEFRHHSFISAIAKGIVIGFGTRGYTMAIETAIANLENA